MKSILQTTISSLALALVLLASTSTLHAAELAGVKFPNETKLDSNILKLNGLGLRTATFFAIKVYVAALYLENPTKDAKSILESKERKRLVLLFVRSVSADKLKDAWREGFVANGADTEAIKPKINKLCELMMDVKEGDSLSFNFKSDQVAIQFRGKEIGIIDGADFSKSLLEIWLGAKPPNQDLKTGLLGQTVS